jgi:hypothetical protein
MGNTAVCWFTLSWCCRRLNDGQVGHSRYLLCFLLLWIRVTKLHSTKNSSIACITDLTPAELCVGYTLNRADGEVAVQSRRIGISCPLFNFRSLLLIYFIVYLFCTYTLLCFLSCLYVFRGVSISFSWFPSSFSIFVTFLSPVLQLIVFVLGSFYFVLDYLFLSVYYFFSTLSSRLTLSSF